MLLQHEVCEEHGDHFTVSELGVDRLHERFSDFTFLGIPQLGRSKGLEPLDGQVPDGLTLDAQLFEHGIGIDLQCKACLNQEFPVADPGGVNDQFLEIGEEDRVGYLHLRFLGLLLRGVFLARRNRLIEHEVPHGPFDRQDPENQQNVPAGLDGRAGLLVEVVDGLLFFCQSFSPPLRVSKTGSLELLELAAKVLEQIGVAIFALKGDRAADDLDGP